MLSQLYDHDPRAREVAAAAYSVLASDLPILNVHRRFWPRELRSGLDWPPLLVSRAQSDTWPAHAFGTANASVVLLWHRPGGATPPESHLNFIGPQVPVLGGGGHPHVKYYGPQVNPKNKSWKLLHKYLPGAFDSFGLDDFWSQVMVACLNPEHGVTGENDVSANSSYVQAGNRISTVLELCQPLLVLLCGNAVHKQESRLRAIYPRCNYVKVDHPSAWEGFGSGRKQGPEIAEILKRAILAR